MVKSDLTKYDLGSLRFLLSRGAPLPSGDGVVAKVAANEPSSMMAKCDPHHGKKKEEGRTQIQFSTFPVEQKRKIYRVAFIDCIPKSANGKILRKELVDLAISNP
ncbi:hypothetical protein LWI28_023137 [Acer negundo]|uniref:AMP-binding enzyme C-terminal domain-containing protein n=1 Tax=Acer negundo TaxID=4023 RepID=A0AAD5NST5_ACENE|nr:hypothetical protein LWI28_023137 [Acer negundo]KAK4845331.1 hypothetical protein QYF36_003668 [Acer negundo]